MLQPPAAPKDPLLAAFSLTAIYTAVEVVGGLLTGSLLLLSDAAHMETDVLGLGMALAAIQLASRPAPAHRTYCLYRLDVLAALENGVLLVGVAAYVLYVAYQRFLDPPEVSWSADAAGSRGGSGSEFDQLTSPVIRTEGESQPKGRVP
jgi:cobalt-zinc-cadmium efflux system protein